MNGDRRTVRVSQRTALLESRVAPEARSLRRSHRTSGSSSARRYPRHSGRLALLLVASAACGETPVEPSVATLLDGE